MNFKMVKVIKQIMIKLHAINTRYWFYAYIKGTLWNLRLLTGMITVIHSGWIDHITATKSARYQIMKLSDIPGSWGCGIHSGV